MIFKNPLLKNAFLFFGSLILTVLVAEAVTAILFPQRIIQYRADDIFFTRYDPDIGWVNKEGASGKWSQAPSTVPPTTIRINQTGFRGGEYTVDKKPGNKRVVVLGDSNTFGYGVEENERFTEMLAGHLPKYYEVFNLGVFGYGTDQEFLMFERKGLALDPDIVVLGFSAGDLSDNMNSINAGFSKPYFRIEGEELVLKNTPVPESLIYLKGKSRESSLVNFFYRHSHLFRFSMYRLSASHLYSSGSMPEMSEQEALRTTAAIIKLMDDMCIERGRRLVVFLISHEAWVAASSKRPGLNIGYYTDLKKWLDEMGVPFIDTTEQFSKDYVSKDYELGEGLFLKDDPVHLNARGHRLAAGILYNGLLSSGFIGR